MSLHGVKAGMPEGKIGPARTGRIMHKQILGTLQESSSGGRNVAEIYRSEVLQLKTRTIQLL